MDYSLVMSLVELGIVLAMLVASEAAFRAAYRRKRAKDEVLLSEISIARATTFGMLGILLAFTVSMAQDRFVARRQMIVDEANAISTTYLRSRYLAEPHDAELAPLFRRYVDVRVAFYASGGDAEATKRAIAASDRIQAEIWEHARAVVREDPQHGDTIAEFVSSLNEMIDLEDARVASLFQHIPPSVIVLLFLIALLACGTNGYACGLTGQRTWLTVTLLPLLVAIAVCVVVDLDSPRVGIVTTGQVPMVRLQHTLAAAKREAGLPVSMRP